MSTNATLAGAIDCDVHCAPDSFAALEPYVERPWREYVDEAGIAFSGHAGGAYPPGVTRAPAHYDELVADYLERADPRFAVLNCLTLNETHRNPYYAAAIARALNDWLRAEWLDRDERLRASLVISTLDPAAAVEEIDRLGGDDRFVQVLLPVRNDVPYGNLRYHPIYEAAERHGLAIGIHAWGRAGNAPGLSGLTTTYLSDVVANSQIVQTQLVSLVAEGIFERFGDLRVVLMECGFTWLPPLLWRFDKDWKGVWREVPWLRERPSVYVRRHVRATTAPAQLPADPDARALMLDLVGTDLLLYASDHPHEHGGTGATVLEAVDDAAAEAIAHENAAAFYGLGAMARADASAMPRR